MRQRFTFQDISNAIGEPAARALIVHFGGTTIAIPAKPRPGRVYDELVAAIGASAAALLIRDCARLNLSIPRDAAGERARRDAELQARFDAVTSPGGLSARRAVSQLAREFHLCESSVWRALKRAT